MSFTAHVEYLFHITCTSCHYYWTYASMEKNFDIERRPLFCPLCGEKGKVKLQDEVGK
ncbi:MAG: hypothetical protein VX444_02345 [Pseudomonadota bacterium]|nr:hypothetical protein [Pseudomonadota bacterium]